MNKVSIIIPIYNASKYLNKCLDSIVNQTYQNIEIILINDGSTDNSLDIMKQYEDKYKTIKCYTQENMGAANTRNKGIKLATGDYITFIDADDSINLDYIELLINNIYDNDIIVCGYKVFDDNYKFLYEKYPRDNKAGIFSQLSSVCKLYKKELIVNNNISFANQKIGEDMIFTLKCYANTDKIKVIPYTGYLYYMNPNSVMHTLSSDNKLNLFDTIKQVDKEIDLSKYGKIKYFLYLKTIVLNITKQPNNTNKNELNELYINSFNWLKSIYKKIKFIWVKGVEFKINFANNIFIMCYKLHLTKLLIKIIKK